jgi:hypothetical protein
MRWIIGVLLCCAPATAFCGAKPIPPVFLDWTKPGATILDVKKYYWNAVGLHLIIQEIYGAHNG